MVWPGKVKEPLTVTAPCVTSDYFPPILSSLGIELPADRVYDDLSLWPFIEEKSTERSKPIGFLNKDAKESVWMEERYKLISTPKGDRLYDIIKDSSEKVDLSKDLPEIVEAMKIELTQWKDSVLAELKAIE